MEAWFSQLEQHVVVPGSPLMATHRWGERLLNEPAAGKVERKAFGNVDCAHGISCDEPCPKCQAWFKVPSPKACQHRYIMADGSCRDCRKPEVVKVTRVYTGMDAFTDDAIISEYGKRFFGGGAVEGLHAAYCGLDAAQRDRFRRAGNLVHSERAKALEMLARAVMGITDEGVIFDVNDFKKRLDSLLATEQEAQAIANETKRIMHPLALPERKWFKLDVTTSDATGGGLSPSEQALIDRSNETTRKCVEAASAPDPYWKAFSVREHNSKDPEARATRPSEVGPGIKSLPEKRPDNSVAWLDEDLLCEDV